MRVSRRTGAATAFAAMALATSGCIPAAGDEVASAPPTAAKSSPATAAGMLPSGADPTPVRPATFTLKGEMTQGGWIRGEVPDRTRTLALDGEPVNFTGNGEFFLAFDRDAGPSATLTATLDDGSTITRDLTVSPRSWNIEHVNIARRTGGPSEAFMRIRQPELAQIVAARARNTKSEGWRQDFIWPLEGRISGRFGSQRIYRGEPGSYHSGIDVATGTSGTPFVAPADGTVILATPKPFSLEGNLLMVDHGMGLNSAFLHLSEISVKDGQEVKQGQLLGRIGSTGRATGPHLHWSIKWNDARLDPILLTGPMP